MNFKKQETSGPAAPSLAGDQARHIGRYGESMIRAYSRGKQSIALDLKRLQLRGGSAAEFSAFIASEMRQWAQSIKASSITAE